MNKPYIDNEGAIHFDRVDSPTIDALDRRVTAIENGGGGGGAPATSFKRFTNSGTLTQGETLNTTLVHVCKDITISAIIKGPISSVYIGVAFQGVYGRWLEITPTEVVNITSSGTPVSYPHNLQLGNRTTVSITRETGNAALILINDEGEVFKQSITYGVNVGKPFVKNNGAGNIEVTLNYFLRDATKEIWLFGDSYFSFQDSARWPYYFINWNYTNWLMDARGGEHAGEGLIDFQNLLSIGARPKYIVWCHGMNRGADENNSVNSAWLQYTQEVLALCQTYGIIPILATIPTTPNSAHVRLNEWVKNSGYRYIDFAAAVEQEGTNSWKGYGTQKAMLSSSDNTHPTKYGAVALASQVLVDFPEITLI